jgi:putative hydrolases of HD superfamily
MEWADAYKVATMLVRHDIAETRIGDIHKVGARYLWSIKKQAEKQVMHDQFDGLDFAEDISMIFNEYEEKTTLEWKIAKDADYLEQAFQAKIYVEQWYSDTQNWIDNVGKALQTESARKIFEEMIVSRSTDWWRKNDLKKI